MKIENYLLKDIKFIESPNYKKKFKKNNLKYLIMHYTGGTTLEGTVNTFKNKNAKVSAHIIIDRDGTVVQMVPFDCIAWHAGKSKWNGLKSLNNYSIGIEFVNVGKLERKKIDGIYYVFKDYWGHEINGKDVCIYNPLEYDENFGFSSYWHNFPDIQIEKGLEVSKLLIEEYNLIDILGHNDISPGRKIDPGPVFYMKRFKDLFNEV